MTDFTEFAQLQRIGSAICLVNGGYVYQRNRQIHERSFWRCSMYKKYGCRGRAITCIINGYEMVKKYPTKHVHPTQEIMQKWH